MNRRQTLRGLGSHCAAWEPGQTPSALCHRPPRWRCQQQQGQRAVQGRNVPSANEVAWSRRRQGCGRQGGEEPVPRRAGLATLSMISPQRPATPSRAPDTLSSRMGRPLAWRLGWAGPDQSGLASTGQALSSRRWHSHHNHLAASGALPSCALGSSLLGRRPRAPQARALPVAIPAAGVEGEDACPSPTPRLHPTSRCLLILHSPPGTQPPQ